MFWIVETEEQEQALSEGKKDAAYVDIIPCDHERHPQENAVCAVYFRRLESPNGVIIPIDHSESSSFDQERVWQFLMQFQKLYCLDKKRLLHYYPATNLWDIRVKHDVNLPTGTQLIYRRHSDADNLNKIVPLTKHHEYHEDVFEAVKDSIGKNDDTQYGLFYNTKSALVFYAIERNGIGIRPDLYAEYFHEVDSDVVYTEYNLSTLTTRPSNTYEGVNYAAIPKGDKRKTFVPKNDEFIELDIKAYHPTLISKYMLGMDLGDDPYGNLADQLKVSMEDVKGTVFNQIYGETWKQYKDVPFFAAVDKTVNQMWKIYQERNGYTCPLSGYQFQDVESPRKLFNYVLQNLETSINCEILLEIIKALMVKKSELVLYTYDSFLLDYVKEDGDILTTLTEFFTKRGLSVRVNRGSDYDFR